MSQHMVSYVWHVTYINASYPSKLKQYSIRRLCYVLVCFLEAKIQFYESTGWDVTFWARLKWLVLVLSFKC